MKKHFETLLNQRKALVDLVKDLDEKTINQIPAPFNNNIVWNTAHLISVHQLIAYGLSDVAYTVDKELVMAYRKNTRPETHLSKAEFHSICELLTDSIIQFENDYNDGLFNDFKPFIAKSIDVTYNTIEEVTPFITLHDSIHITTIRNYLRVLV